MSKKQILQELIDFTEVKFKELSGTYLDTYRASRQAYKNIHKVVKDIAKKESIEVKVKKLKCVFD